MPEWFDDFEDAEALGVHPWDVGKVPLHWRMKARIVNVARKEARVKRFNDAQGQKTLVYPIEV